MLMKASMIPSALRKSLLKDGDGCLRDLPSSKKYISVCKIMRSGNLYLKLNNLKKLV